MTKETYSKSVDILLDAYNTGKLLHGNCRACACGNLLGGNLIWGYSFCTTEGSQRKPGRSYIDNLIDIDIKKIGVDPTKMTDGEVEKYIETLITTNGYTEKELRDIEYAFESSIYDTSTDEPAEEVYEYYQHVNPQKGQLIGLTAVLRIMATMVEEEVDTVGDIHKLETIAQTKYSVMI